MTATKEHLEEHYGDLKVRKGKLRPLLLERMLLVMNGVEWSSHVISMVSRLKTVKSVPISTG